MANIITNVIAGVGQITLDRPAALNALNLDMVRAMNKVLTDWREDPTQLRRLQFEAPIKTVLLVLFVPVVIFAFSTPPVLPTTRI